MKVVRYTLLKSGKIPKRIVSGGFFPKPNGRASPQDYDLIGLSKGWPGIQEFTTKLEFETHVKSFYKLYLDHPIPLQELLDGFWNRILSER